MAEIKAVYTFCPSKNSIDGGNESITAFIWRTRMSIRRRGVRLGMSSPEALADGIVLCALRLLDLASVIGRGRLDG